MWEKKTDNGRTDGGNALEEKGGQDVRYLT